MKQHTENFRTALFSYYVVENDSGKKSLKELSGFIFGSEMD